MVVAATGETSSTDISLPPDGAKLSVIASRESGGGEAQGTSSEMCPGDWGLGGGSLPNGWGMRIDWVGSMSSVLSVVTLSVTLTSPAGILGVLDDPFAICFATWALRAADMGPVRIRAVVDWRWVRMGPEVCASGRGGSKIGVLGMGGGGVTIAVIGLRV